jgi:hypothetical protein
MKHEPKKDVIGVALARLVRLVRRQLWRAVLCEPEERAELRWNPDPARLARYQFTYQRTPCDKCRGSGWATTSLSSFPCRKCAGKGSLPNS